MKLSSLRVWPCGCLDKFNNRVVKTSSFSSTDFMGTTANIGGPFNSQSSVFGKNSKEAMAMLCENCGRKFSIFRIKKQCTECHRLFCSNCLLKVGDRGKKACLLCQVFNTKPLHRSQLMGLKVKDLQWYLNSKQVSMRSCVEKEDLVSLILQSENRSNRQQPTEEGRRHSFSGRENNSPTEQTGRRTFSPDHTPGTADPLFRSCENVMPRTVPSRSDTSDRSEPFVVINSTTNLDDEVLMDVDEIVGNEIPSERLRAPTESYFWNPSPPLPPQPPTGSSFRNRSTPAQPAAPPGINQSPPASPQAQSGTFFWNPSPPTPPQPSSFWDNSPPMPPQPQTFRNYSPVSPSHSPPPPGTTSSNNSSPSRQRSTVAVELNEIKRETELDVLTVKQLKTILANNRVDYRGCCEKSELLEKTRMLWKAETEAKKDLENIPDDNLCKICMNSVIDCVMLECGHMATCITCGKQMNECPICRCYVVRVVRTFRA